MTAINHKPKLIKENPDEYKRVPVYEFTAA